MEINHRILFKAIVGSQSYGTAIEGSDVDVKGVYIQGDDELLGFGYMEQMDYGKDECYYEVRRFLQLLETGNPTVLELLWSPEDCVVDSSAAFGLIVAERDRFLTKKCLMSFGGYAVAQIKKARGLDKKMNWEKDRVERKGPIDFVYAYENGKTYPILRWLKDNDCKQEFCGLVGLDHFKDCYGLYYDFSAHYGPNGNRTWEPLGFHGIVGQDSNDIRLSSIPKGMTCQVIVCYNKDGYIKHCKDFNQYQEWLEKRNNQRYVDVKGHGQAIDGKNLLHCRRLLDMAMEIAKEGKISVRRPNADYLLSIRRGEVKLDDIIDKAEEDLKGLEGLYAKSGLPDGVDRDFVNELLLKVRKYGK